MIGKYPDMTALWHGACERLLYAERDRLDRWTGLTIVLYDNMLAADSMAFDFDVGRDLWLTKARFPKLQRDYLEPEEVEPFLERCKLIADGAARRGVITQMNCRKAVRKKDGWAQHAWGNCMLAFTYHGGKGFNPPTLALHSRVSYIAYLGAMDMALAWVLGREIAERTGIDVGDIRFRWYIDALQWHGMKSIPYVLAHGHEEAIMDEEKHSSYNYPTIGVTRRSIASLDRKYQAGLSLERTDNPYGPVRRMRKRYHNYQETGKAVPDLPLEDLNLLPEMLNR